MNATDVNLRLRFAAADVPEGVDPTAWAAQLVKDALRDANRVEPVRIGPAEFTLPHVHRPHPDTNPTVLTRITAGDVTVGVDESLSIVLWFPRPMSEWTISNVDRLVEALAIARDRQHILEGA